MICLECEWYGWPDWCAKKRKAVESNLKQPEWCPLILRRTGRKMGKATLCRTCGGAISASWPAVCGLGCQRFYAPGCACGECQHTTPDTALCSPAWAERRPIRTEHRARCTDELRGDA